MVADTAVTGNAVSLREREFQPKIEPAHNKSLLGFAGSFEGGRQVITEASQLPVGKSALDFLLQKHLEIGSDGRGTYRVDFAYGFQTDDGPQLFRIAEGVSSRVTTLHLGIAFSDFQTIRHNNEIDHAPKAIHQFMFAAPGEHAPPHGLSASTRAMLQLFATREEHDIGGWAVPYLLTPDRAQLCTYGYSVTDPITDELRPGHLIPHGMAYGGGFGLSFAGLREGDGMVVYWLQLPGGRVLVRNGSGYDEYSFSGGPTSFKEEAYQRLGRVVDIWFGDQPLGAVEKVSFIRDESGRPRFTIAQDGESLSFAWVQNTEESFRAAKTVQLRKDPIKETEESDLTRPMSISMTLAADSDTVTLELLNEGQALGHIILGAVELDKLIASLGAARASMLTPVPSDISPGTELHSIVDPAWRTRAAPHPSVAGPLLALRHTGFSWLSFVLPFHEAQTLGAWLLRQNPALATTEERVQNFAAQFSPEELSAFKSWLEAAVDAAEH